MQNPLAQEQFVMIEKIDGELCIGVHPPQIQSIIVQCFACQKKNQCPARTLFMKCGFCAQINKVSDADPMFYIDIFCSSCSKRMKVQKNATIYRCPFCQTLNRKHQR